MNNDNIVKIGTALKWRNVFDPNKRYYQENIVTMCGCIFRCKVLQTQGKSPIQVTDETGHIAYANPETWDVVLDMLSYYNFAVDSHAFTENALKYIRDLDSAIQSQQDEIIDIQTVNKAQSDDIDDIKQDDINQWRAIDRLYELANNHRFDLDILFNVICCYSLGIWYDNLRWSNEAVWSNNANGSGTGSGVDMEMLLQRIAKLEDKIEKSFTKTYHAEISNPEIGSDNSITGNLTFDEGEIDYALLDGRMIYLRFQDINGTAAMMCALNESGDGIELHPLFGGSRLQGHISNTQIFTYKDGIFTATGAISDNSNSDGCGCNLSAFTEQEVQEIVHGIRWCNCNCEEMEAITDDEIIFIVEDAKLSDYDCSHDRFEGVDECKCTPMSAVSVSDIKCVVDAVRTDSEIPADGSCDCKCPPLKIYSEGEIKDIVIEACEDD